MPLGNDSVKIKENLAKGSGTEIFRYQVSPKMREKDLYFNLYKNGSKTEYTEETERFKKEQNKKLFQQSYKQELELCEGINISPQDSNNSRYINPIIATNFSDPDINSYYPNDNSVAISSSGIIFSTKNSMVSVYNESGGLLMQNSIYGFLGNNTSFTGFLFDPHIIYDNVNDRFIFVCLDANNSLNNKLIVAFSMSNDPTGVWWVYAYNVAQTIQSGLWFDFPLIGINQDYLVVSGNLFNDGSNNAATSCLVRFEKSLGYSASTLGYTYWSGLIDANNLAGFSIYPLSYGAEGTYNANQNYFVSTFSASGNYYQFWIMDNVTDIVTGYTVNSNSYSIGADSPQFGSNILLDVGDCRVCSGFYLYDSNTQSGRIHFTFTSIWSGSGLNNGAINARIDWAPSGVLTSSSMAVGDPQANYAHPSIAYFGSNNNVSQGDVLLSSTFCSPNHFPESRVFTTDNSNTIGYYLTVKLGESPILNEFVSGASNTCRWGDYIGLTRKFGSFPTKLWTAVSYGNSINASSTWLAEIYDVSYLGNNEKKILPPKLYPNPAFKFINLEFENQINQQLEILIFDFNGKLVDKLYSGYMAEGMFKFRFDCNKLENGTYFVKVLSSSKNDIFSESFIVLN
jgi:hypothetical protein